MTRCTRCDEARNCQQFTIHAIALCESCLDEIIQEWQIKRQEIGELVTS